jgi:hypothetical protein
MPSSDSIFTKFIDDLEKEPNKADPANELLTWLMYRWPGTTITLRDVCRCGPNFLRDDRESVFNLAEVLVRQGRLVPLQPSRRDTREWHVVREPVRK